MRKRKYFYLRYARRINRSRLLTGLIISALLVIAILLSYRPLIEYYTNRVVETAVTEYVEQRSAGRYILEYDSIHLDIWKNEVSFNDLHLALKPDTSLTNNENEIIDLKASFLKLKVGGLLTLWASKELTVQAIVLDKPLVKWRLRAHKNKGGVTQKTGDLYARLKQYLEELSINELEILHANISFYNKNFDEVNRIVQLPDLTLRLQDFHWEVDQNIGDLESDYFSLTIVDQEFILPDSSATVHFDSITFSLTPNKLSFSQGRIRPYIKNEPSTIIDSCYFSFTELSFTDINLAEAYASNSLFLDTIKLSGANLSQFESFDFNSLTNNGDKGTPLIDSIYAKYTILEDGVIHPSRFKSLYLNIDHIGLSLSGLSIGGEGSKVYSYDSLSFLLKNGKGIIAENDIIFSFNDLIYSPEHEVANFDSLRVSQGKEDQISVRSFRIYFPKVQIAGLGEDSFQGNSLVLDSIRSKGAEIRIHEVTPDVTDSASVNKMLQVSKIAFDSSKIFYTSQNMEVNIERGDFTLYNLKMNNGKLDSALTFYAYWPKATVYSNGNTLRLDGFRTNSKTFTLSVDQLAYNDLLSANKFSLTYKQPWWRLSQDSILISHISLSDYSIRTKDKGTVSEFNLPYIYIDSLNTLNGVFDYLGENKLKISSNIGKAKIRGLKAHQSDLDVGEYNIDFSKTQLKNSTSDIYLHQINANSITKKVLASEIKLIIGDSLNYTTITIPSMRLDQFAPLALSKFIDNPKLTYVEVQKPKVKSYYTSLPTQRFNVSTTFPLVIDQLSILNAKYEGNILGIEQHVDRTTMHLNDIDFKRDAQWTSENDYKWPFTTKLQAELEGMLIKDSIKSLAVEAITVNNDIKIYDVYFNQSEKDSIGASIDTVSFKKVAFNSLLKNNKFKAEELFLNQLDFAAHLNGEDNNLANSTNLTVDIESVIVNNANVSVQEGGKKKLRLSPLHLSLSHVYFDSLTDFNETLVPARSIRLNTKDLEFTTPDGLNRFSIGSLNLGENQKDIIVEEVKLTPLHPPQEYFDLYGEQTDWMRLEIPSVELENINIRKLLRERAFLASSVKLNQPKLEVYRDKNHPEPIRDYKPLPIQQFKNLSQAIAIDSITIDEAFLSYAETPDKGTSPGLITFEKMDVKASNITNQKTIINSNNHLRVNVNTDLMGSIDTQVQFKFDLDDVNNTYWVAGDVSTADIRDINDFSELGAFVKIKSGEAKRLQFTAEANEDRAFGTMFFEYNDLKIALVDKQTSNTEKFEESVASFMANTFLVRKRNSSLFKLRKGTIYFERDKNKSIFNYWSKLFTSGVASSVGFKNNRKHIRRMAKATSK